MSETLTAVIVDALTGEVIERPLTPEELSEREVMQAEFEAQETERIAKAEARQSAFAKLAALGLTDEEVAAL